MSSLIENLWIFSKEGKPLIEIFHNTEFDSSLLGSFLSAIETFTKNIVGTDLKNVSIGESKFFLTSCLNGAIFLVSKSDPKVKDKQIRKVFKVFTEFFEELYTISDIVNWEGDLSFFNVFKDRIVLYFQMSQL